MSVKKEENGTWTATGRYPKGPDGKVRSYKRRSFSTKKEAKEAEKKLLEEFKGVTNTHMTVNELIEEYHKDAPILYKESTLKGYYRIERTFIIPQLGTKYIDKLTTMDIQRWINTIYENGYDGNKYSDETIKSILLHLSGLLTYAMKHDWLIKNPCNNVDRPRNPNKKSNELSSKDNYWEIDEYNEFMETVEDGERYDIYEFCFYTGLRIGEFCALQWKHVDFENKTITIEQSLSSITSKITSPKTDNSYRTITVPNKIMDKLQLKYSYVSQIRNFNDEWYVYKNETYISVGTLRRWFNEDVRKAGVKIITFHGLRHSHTSYLLSNPMISEQLIADRLGHTVAVLRKTYAHVYKKHRKYLDDYISNL
ncbi:MAG: site-specific integrase [Erysipelotrichaceae bacterium]|nr:site-specific integrase [Erysipelotrichaceae bacterium]